MGERSLSGWGRTSPTGARITVPISDEDLTAILRKSSPRGTIARGLGRSYGDAAQNAGGRVLDMTELAGLREADLETGVVTVSAGTSLDKLLRMLLPRGWFPAVTPGTRFVTVGGAIASDVHGKNHHLDGGFCDHVLSFELISPGTGRQVVIPGDEVFAATAGGMGLTGVIAAATLQLVRVQTSRIRQDTERAADLDDLMARMEDGDDRFRYSVAWLDTLAQDRRLGRGVLTRGDHASLDELPASQRGNPFDPPPGSLLSVPPGMPSRLLGRATARAFNEIWYQKAPRLERARIVPLHRFFYPLDAVTDWNRIYGRRGFVQYQFVVPFGHEAVVRKVLERIAATRCPSFLAVLKRFGPGRGSLSFPIPGWTLALDLPARTPGLAELLDGLDRLVAGCGGRVYLTKDSRMLPELVAEMYPGLERWRGIRARLDPDHQMMSDLDRRLGLSGTAEPTKRKKVRA